MAKRKSKTEKPVYNRIKEVLEDLNKSQTWLAEQLDVDFQTVTRYANNHRQPTIEKLFKIAAILKINPRELLNS
ncbi:helix-turn-helix domain-containing protein [Chryseolinea lacunae]|uniref:Helix-turn-helix transcriptional regulator n=1 Tax=Chryseolinea lacunae TaxID=2801331 RepID=A0ABS1KQ23_9BACT|nr:helix-turn-helix transcriptional regulator [Chryseolinea lacunae]MBL0741425.1 helix-turn-helix transcriptional regulator [Chryseolinea lacunae]